MPFDVSDRLLNISAGAALLSYDYLYNLFARDFPIGITEERLDESIKK
jgi:hypothetical protein